MYRALHGIEYLSLDDAQALAEIDEVGRSWRDAAQANLEDQQARQAAARKRAKGKG